MVEVRKLYWYLIFETMSVLIGKRGKISWSILFKLQLQLYIFEIYEDGLLQIFFKVIEIILISQLRSWWAFMEVFK